MTFFGMQGSGTGAVDGEMLSSVNQYFFGNSLVNFAGGSSLSNVPSWLNRFIEAAGFSYAANGGYGFLRQFADRPTPADEWGFQGVDGAWSSDTEAFSAASFDNVIITPANFIQDQAPTAHYPGDGRSPVDATADVVAQVRAEQPGATIYIYQGWADLGPFAPNFPPTTAQLASYYAYAAGDYSAWYDTYIADVEAAVPGATLQLIPVSDVFAALFTGDGPLADLSATDLYVDSAPHGTETLYFLAAMVTYSAIFEEPVTSFGTVPAVIHPEVANNLTRIATFIDAQITPPTNGTPGDDTLTGDDAANSFNGDTGEDTIRGEGGNDTINGDDGNDSIFGGTGNDVLNGGKDRNQIMGDAGRDTISGGQGNDTLRGNGGDDYIRGEGGVDWLYGGFGNDTIEAGWGWDRLIGNSGDDVLVGANGRDRLNGGTGNDTLTGAAHGDYFQFRTGDGSDTITDFQNGLDQIHIFSGANAFGDVTVTDLGPDTQISFLNVAVLLLNVDHTVIDASDFLF